MHHCEDFFLYFLDFSVQTVGYDCLSVYRNASQNEDPCYNGYIFAVRNQTRPLGINNSGNTPYGVGMAQNQPPLHYPAMLNPYPIYQNPVPASSNYLHAYLIILFPEGCLFLCNCIPKGNMKPELNPTQPIYPSQDPQTQGVCNHNYCCGHTVADTNVSPFACALNICCGHKFCVRDTKMFLCSETFCVRNKCFPVCAAQETSQETMCPQQCVLVYQGL